MGEGTRYIDVPATDLLTELRSIGKAIAVKGGKYAEDTSGAEVFFDFEPPNRPGRIRVYTSLGTGRITVRDCGQDAVRLVLGTIFQGRFRPLAQSRRIYRTAPKGDRNARIAAFLERLKVAIRDTYRDALKVPVCPVCNCAMRLRENKKTGHKFYGCLQYPNCRGTRPTNGKH